MESHLNDDQIEELLRPGRACREESTLDREADEEVLTHLKVCKGCQARVREQQRAVERLELIKLTLPSAPSSQCPPDDVWMEVATGMATYDSETNLSHAANCDHCGPLLRQAVLDLATELTPDEDSMISNLPSSTTNWQKTLATRLSEARSLDAKVRSQKKRPPSWRSLFASPGRLTFAVSAVGLIAFGVWFAVYHIQSESPERLIANAFTEKRTLEVRIEGVPYVPLRQERGGKNTDQGRMSRPALLKAEAEIARQLRSHPDDARWLHASGRVDLLEDDTAGAEAAITALERAQLLAPNDTSVSVDRASAYILRGQLLNRTEDYGTSIEILGRVLSSDSGNEVAKFNYAIALEKELFKRQAAEAWKAYIAQFPKSAWTPEAQERLSRLLQELRDQQGRSETPLRTLDQVAAAFAFHDESTISQIDARIEEYQNRAIENWLPLLFSVARSDNRDKESIKGALTGLARILTNRHHDSWLQDLLDADQNSPTTDKAVRSLGRSVSEIETSDDSQTRSDANQALLLFRKSKVEAGEIRARLMLLLLDQFEHRYGPCEKMAQSMRRDQHLRRYPWILIQVQLEDGLCASVSDKDALQSVQSSLELARVHQFPILAMRATAAETGLYSALGDSHRAWMSATDGLNTYWSGTYPRLRGYNAVVAFDEINYPQERWFFETAILKEALPMVDGDSRTTMVAVEQARLGQTLMQAGDLEGAENSYRETESLMKKSPPGLERTALSAEAELGFAKVDLHRNELNPALKRLNSIRSNIVDVPDDLIALDFYQTSGTVEMRLNDLNGAERDLNAGIRLAESGLRLVENDEDRLRWNLQNEALYRTLVELELKLRSDPRQALLDWEWYKSAAVRGRPSGSSDQIQDFTSIPSQINGILSVSGIDDKTLLVSYFLAPHAFFVWVSDHRIVKGLWVPVESADLSSLIARFEEHCSAPHSDYAVLSEESARLYEIVISPIEPWLVGREHLVIEPDGALKALPLELLLNSKSEFLGDRFSISTSPGIAYLNRSRKWSGISSTSEALVMGDPNVPGWMPLPDAQAEARTVAAYFKRPQLVTGGQSSVRHIATEIAHADVFHFSGHSHISIESAGLVFDNLGADDLIDLDREKQGRTQLVVLSACSSSHGTGGSFDDSDSMARRLMSARIPVVVASRWKVDSAATAYLMKLFYAELISGKSPSDALRSASRGLRSRPEYSHPFYWGGFSVFGSV